MPTQFHTLCQDATLYEAWNTVKSKGSAGGIDGVTIQEFDQEKRKQISVLTEELKNGKWKPFPYLEIEIPKSKDPKEKRKLGMIAIRDKIVQQAIRSIIEPRYDRIFVGNSYGYRPGRGATRAIRRVLFECSKSQYHYVLRLDIDNFFDTIDHEILQKRLIATGTDSEIVRLIMLCMQMGKVRKNSHKWIETDFGTPQGAVLSPVLSNLYLHSFDQFAISRGVPYVRYADDFLFLAETQTHAEEILAARLNPYDSIIHVHQEGKPTLVYDMVEIFRSQVVDRIVISLIQKGQDLEISKGLLTDKTRQLLVKSVMERLARYEKYQGEEMKMEQIILRQAQLLAKAFEGTETFKPYVAKW